MARKNRGSEGHEVLESVYGQDLGQQGRVLGSKLIHAGKRAPANVPVVLSAGGAGSGGTKTKKNIKKKGKNVGKKPIGSAQGQAQVLDPAAIKKRQKKARESFRAGRQLLEKLVDGSNVILLVLDARDPQRCRSTFLEKLVKDSGKKLVFILNKTDLVPRQNVERWLQVLRQDHVTIPYNAIDSPHCADALAKLLSFSNKNKTAQTTVGIVGFPGVGRASLLRSLKQSKDLNSTTIKFFVNLGTLLCNGGRGPVESMLRSKILPGEDLISATESILMRCKQQTLMVTYSVPRFDTGAECLASLARQQGHLFKGGIPDTLTTARTFLKELCNGKSPFYTNPPSLLIGKEAAKKGGFGLNADYDGHILDEMSFSDVRGYLFILAGQSVLEEDLEVEEEEEEEDEIPELVTIVNSKKRLGAATPKPTAAEEKMEEVEEEGDSEDSEDETMVPSVTSKRGAKAAPTVQRRPAKKIKKSTITDEDGDAPYTFGEFV